jgi:beta-galactosidase
VQIEITDSQFLLNGEPVRIGGYNRISDHRYWGTSEPDELLANDIALMKNSGANFMRIMHGTQNKKLIELCDEAGILIFEEANIRELTNPEFVAPDYTLNKQWIKEMIERDINHPSIIGWSIGNELKEHYQYVDSVITYVKTELDSTRLVTNVSNTGYRPIDSAENDPLGLSDLMMQNIYQKDPESVISTIEERWPNRPLFISEYGLGRFDTASLDNDYPSFSSWHEMIRGRNTHVVGTSVWSFNDYRSGYAQSLEEENRAWGVVNTWRQKRRAYSTFQQELSPIKSLTLENVNLSKKSAQVAISVRSLQDYPSYTMKDYQLEWELKAKDGEILATNSLAMPTLTPNDPTWKSAIDWSGEFANIYSLTVRVMSSNGYTRFETTKDLLKPLVPQINNVLTSDNAIHVEFEKQNNEVEHFIRYTSSNGKVIESAKTISNYIRLTGLSKRLSSGDKYTLALIASNNLGDSKPSTPVNVTLAGKPLAPIIYKVMVDEDNLIVGFSGLADDRHYILKYGYDEKTLNMMETSSGRGMITAKINSGTTKVYFQLKRVGLSSESQWTNIRSINVH